MHKNLLTRLLAQQDLTRSQAEHLMHAFMLGSLDDVVVAGLLTALRMKGETTEEITGFVAAMRENALPVRPRQIDTEALVDTCGTGGDGKNTFNISTATALVTASLGIPVAKHGNGSVSSRSGSSDVLGALGIAVHSNADSVAAQIDRYGIGFMHAPFHHPSARHVAGVRRGLGIRTVFNLLGPMTNPAGVKRQLLGVFDATLTEVVARVLRNLGTLRAYVVHGLDGCDEVSLSGPTQITELKDGAIRTTLFSPEDAGLARAPLKALVGGTPEENARRIQAIFEGARGPSRDAVVLNAAFVALAAGRVDSVKEGVEVAASALDSGAPGALLSRLVSETRERAA
jgi:anthranilate phosphoribosyltransferase